MAQSLSKVVLHLVFSVKNRQRAFINSQIRSELAQYITGIVRGIGCQTIKIEVVEDHIHLMYMLSRTKTISDSVAIIKRESSIWIKTQEWAKTDNFLNQFQWQHGYGVFSVSESQINKVAKYIDNQEEHHKEVSYQDELRAFLEKHKVKYDEKYLWE